MKEKRFFYVPDAASQTEMPEEEAMHALRVLRLKSGDEMFLMDGVGNYYRAEVELAATRRCTYKLLETMPQAPQWKGKLHLAIAPTKLMDRMEWMVEKATEIGVNAFDFLNCKQSERKVLRTVRLDKIVTAAVKQSRKAWKPVVGQMTPFKQYVSTGIPGRKYICHCIEDMPRKDLFYELRDNPIQPDEDITIMIGPEGDFTPEEVALAVSAGFVPATLGESRLRTETAGLVAVDIFQLAQK